MRRLLPLVVLALAVAACGDDGTGPDGPSDDPDAPAPRTYAMGWAPSAPRPEEALFLDVIDSLSRVSEATIIQQEVPWGPLLAGASMDSLVQDRKGLADFLRARGLEIVFLVDPLQGLDRTREARGLEEAGRSILEPEIRAMHEAWALAVAEAIRPEWMGLASEINTLAARGDPGLYAELRDMINDLAPRIRSASPGSRVFVSVQADEANGALVDPIVDHFALIDDFDIDALGLSSYPVFAFDAPEDVPPDYLDPFAEATDLPLLMVEGGWSSADVPLASGTTAEQAAYFRRYEELLDRVEARLWVGLTFTDLDVEALDLPPERARGLSNFARMGILDVSLERKPAYAEWERIFQRPLEP